MVVKVFTTNKTSYKILLLNLLMTNTKSQCENNKGLIIAELEMSCGQNFAK